MPFLKCESLLHVFSTTCLGKNTLFIKPRFVLKPDFTLLIISSVILLTQSTILYTFTTICKTSLYLYQVIRSFILRILSHFQIIYYTLFTTRNLVGDIPICSSFKYFCNGIQSCRCLQDVLLRISINYLRIQSLFFDLFIRSLNLKFISSIFVNIFSYKFNLSSNYRLQIYA